MSMDVTDVVGGFGVWQRRIFYVLLYHSIPAAFVIFNVQFFHPDSNFCCVQWSGNKTFKIRPGPRPTFCNNWDSCERYWSPDDRTPEEPIKCASWEFNSSKYGTSIKQEWNLVCHRSWLIDLIYMMPTIGIFISLIPAGHLCDKYGRWRLCLIGMTSLVVVGTGGIFSPNVEVFLFVRLISGVTYGIFQTAAILLFIESVSPEYRASMSLAFMGTWGLGIMILPGVAFLLKDWRMLQLVTCILSLISPILVWIFVPESPRWLLAVGRDEEARKIICKAAKLNGIEILDADTVMQDLKKKVHDVETPNVADEIAQSDSRCPTFSDFGQSKTIKRITVILYLAFLTTGFIYYWCSLLMEKIPSSLVHLKTFAVGLGEAIGSGIFIFQAKFMSRRKCIIRNCFFSGFFLMIAHLFNYNFGLQMTFAVVGITCNSLALTFLWLSAAEIFPTNLRATGISKVMCVARIGSIFGILMNFLRYELGGYLIIAALAFMTSLLCGLLPNIAENNLPDTVEESKRLPQRIERLRRGVDRFELVSFLRRVFVSRN